MTLPRVIGGGTVTLRALIREYLFVSLFRACAESLSSFAPEWYRRRTVRCHLRIRNAERRREMMRFGIGTDRGRFGYPARRDQIAQSGIWLVCRRRRHACIPLTQHDANLVCFAVIKQWNA